MLRWPLLPQTRHWGLGKGLTFKFGLQKGSSPDGRDAISEHKAERSSDKAKRRSNPNATFRDGALAPGLRCAIAHRGISRFRVRCFASPRNDEGKISCGIKLIPPVQSRFQKYFHSRLTQITSKTLAIPPTEGRIAIVTDAERDAVDAAAFCARGDRRAGPKGLVSNRKVR